MNSFPLRIARKLALEKDVVVASPSEQVTHRKKGQIRGFLLGGVMGERYWNSRRWKKHVIFLGMLKDILYVYINTSKYKYT